MEKSLTLSEKIEKIEKLHRTLDSEYEKAIARFREKRDEVNEGYIEIFNFKDRFIKVKDIFCEEYTYMYCDSVWRSTDLSNEPILRFRGYGFYWNISPYEDSTYCKWGEWLDIEIRLLNNNLKDELERFEIITSDEFNDAYNKMIEEMTKRHKNNMEFYIKEGEKNENIV